jgi:hypothetical protein
MAKFVFHVHCQTEFGEQVCVKWSADAWSELIRLEHGVSSSRSSANWHSHEVDVPGSFEKIEYKYAIVPYGQTDPIRWEPIETNRVLYTKGTSNPASPYMGQSNDRWGDLGRPHR